MTATTYEFKPLVWKQAMETYTAGVPLFGLIRIKQRSRGTFYVDRSMSSGRWSAFIDKEYTNLEAAKAATQAAIEAEIRAFLNCLMRSTTSDVATV